MDNTPERSLPRTSGESKNAGTGIGVGAALVTLVAVLCCAGVPALLTFVGTIGLGILIRKHLLFPLMVGALLLGTWGATRSYRTHRNPLVLGGYLLSALALPIGMKASHPLMYAGLAGLLFVTGSDLVLKLRTPEACLTGGNSVVSVRKDGGCPSIKDGNVREEDGYPSDGR